MSGGQETPSSTTSQVTYSPEEQAARDKVMNAALGTYDNAIASNNGEYLGAKPVGQSAATTAGQQGSLAYAGQLSNQLASTNAANNFQMSNAMYAESNPYLQSAMDAATRPMIQQFSDAGGALSGIRQEAQSAGGFGGSRQGIAEGLAASRLQQTVGDTRAKMASDNYNTASTNAQAAVKNQAMLAMLGQMPSQITGQVGAQQDATAQSQENYNASVRDSAANSQWAPLQNLANIIYGGSNGTTVNTGTTTSPDTTMQTVGALGSMAMMAAMMT